MGQKESQDISKRKGVSTNIKLWLSNPLSEEKKKQTISCRVSFTVQCSFSQTVGYIRPYNRMMLPQGVRAVNAGRMRL